MSSSDSIEVHPVAFEVIRSRLLAITEEMRIALQSVSGSPTVTEASDFFTGLFLPDGSFASMGFQVSFQAPVVGHLIRAVHARPFLEPRDGDMFCGNDLFVGALHQNDIQLAGPIYADGKIFAWAGVEQRGGPHYYRVQAPTFLIEYDNTQNNANHIHSVWRDFNGDFGLDLLAMHYQASHGK